MMSQDAQSIPFDYPEEASDSSVLYVYMFVQTTTEEYFIPPLSGFPEATGTSLTELTLLNTAVLQGITRRRQDVDMLMNAVGHEFAEFSKEDLKRSMLERVHEDGPLWPDELADELNADPFDVIEACEELVEEGRLRPLDPEEVPRKDD